MRAGHQKDQDLPEAWRFLSNKEALNVELVIDHAHVTKPPHSPNAGVRRAFARSAQEHTQTHRHACTHAPTMYDRL